MAHLAVKNYGTPEEASQIIVDEVKREFEEWLSTKEDMIWRPPLNLIEKEDKFLVKMIVAGADPKNVEVLIAPEIALIKAALRPNDPTRSGPGKLSRSIRFPRLVNPDNVQAEIKDGLLTIQVEIADTRAKHVLTTAA
jgi:HSP20 family molecular chaperone IbpA